MKETTYQRRVLAVKNRYAKRIEALLTHIADTLKAVGYRCDDEPTFFYCDNYSWNLIVYVESAPGEDIADGDVDITLKICESLDYEGTTEGITFALDVVTVGGRIIGECRPGNYTDECWLPLSDKARIEERFAIFEEADAESMVELLVGSLA
jgi:hypothetical protein